MATTKISPAPKTPAIANSPKQDQPIDPSTVLKPFELSINDCMKELNTIYTDGIKEYEKLIKEYTEKLNKSVGELTDEKQKIATESNKAINEAAVNNASSSVFSEVQTQYLKRLDEITEKESKLAEEINKELKEKTTQINDKCKNAAEGAFGKQNAFFKEKLTELKLDALNGNTLYGLGYLLMACSWYRNPTGNG